MIKRDVKSLAALGRSLTSASERGVLPKAQFAETARALGVAMLTGSIEMEAYAGIHWVLGQLIEAAFSSPKGSAEQLDGHMETVGRMWSYVAPSGGPLAGVDRFFSAAFDLEKASFTKDVWFKAPLKVKGEELGSLLRQAGVAIVSIVPVPYEPTHAALAEEKEAASGGMVLGWGERRVALRLLAE